MRTLKDALLEFIVDKGHFVASWSRVGEAGEGLDRENGEDGWVWEVVCDGEMVFLYGEHEEHGVSVLKASEVGSLRMIILPPDEPLGKHATGEIVKKVIARKRLKDRAEEEIEDAEKEEFGDEEASD